MKIEWKQINELEWLGIDASNHNTIIGRILKVVDPDEIFFVGMTYDPRCGFPAPTLSQAKKGIEAKYL